MAKKKSSTDWGAITRFCAFWAIGLAAVVLLITGIIQILVNLEIITGAGATVNKVMYYIRLVAKVFLFVAIFVPGWRYARSHSRTFEVLFWVFIILVFVFGVIDLPHWFLK